MGLKLPSKKLKSAPTQRPLRYLNYMTSVGERLHQHSFSGDPSEADDIFLFQRILSEQNDHIIFRNLDYMSSVWPMLTMSVPAYIMVRVTKSI